MNRSPYQFPVRRIGVSLEFRADVPCAIANFLNFDLQLWIGHHRFHITQPIVELGKLPARQWTASLAISRRSTSTRILTSTLFATRGRTRV